VLCVVRPNPIGGFVELRYRTPRWRDRYAAITRLESHENAFYNLSEWTRPTVEVGGCRCCGVREISVADLLRAFEDGHAKISA
jgi:hypothetical protein